MHQHLFDAVQVCYQPLSVALDFDSDGEELHADGVDASDAAAGASPTAAAAGVGVEVEDSEEVSGRSQCGKYGLLSRHDGPDHLGLCF